MSTQTPGPADRQPHYLRRVLTSRTPTQIVCVDAERWNGVAIAIHCRAVRRERDRWTRRCDWSGSDPAACWDWIWSRVSPYRGTWIVGTDWGRLASLLDLWSETDRLATAVGRVVLSERVCVIQLIRRGGRCQLVDSRNILPSDVCELSVDSDVPMSITEIVESRCRRLQRTMERLCDAVHAHDLGVMQPTIGAWSSNLWRHWHRGQQVVVHDCDAALKLERRAYYGGQVLCRRVGVYQGSYHGVDVNMMYPAAMGHYLQPTVLEHCDTDVSISDLTELSWDRGAIADCLIDSTDLVYPVRQRYRMVSARGQYWTTLAWPELSVAIEMGHVRQLGLCAIYRLADLFGDWSRRLWSLRSLLSRSGDVDISRVVKHLGTSLHGKLGQHGVDWEDVECSRFRPWSWWMHMTADGKLERRRAVGDKVQRKVHDQQEPRDSYPAIAAWTTSAGRVHMASLREIVGDRNWLYQYTDSLVVTDDGLARLDAAGEIDHAILGRLKHEWMAERLEIRGPGWLMHDDRRRASGIGADTIEVKPHEYIRRITPSIASCLSIDGPVSQAPRVESVCYPPSEICGTVTEDGWVEPLTLSLAESDTCTDQSGSIAQ